LLSSLQGCVAVVAGAAVSGAVATADRRTLGAQTEDKSITVKAETTMPQLTGDARPRQCQQLQPQGAADRRSARRGDEARGREREVRASPTSRT
jgi:osmotically-inducible protein OsmY